MRWQLPKLAFKILCYARSDGHLLWQQTATIATPHQSKHPTNSFASASPCTDGVCVYAHFGSRGLYCYTMDGKLKWQRNDFGKMITRNNFGEGSSPTLAGNKILVPWDHEGPSYSTPWTRRRARLFGRRRATNRVAGPRHWSSRTAERIKSS